LLDVERVAKDGDGRQTERVALGWQPDELERLLQTTSGDEIPLTFDEGALQRLLDEDVEAHGVRETAAVLAVVGGLAAAGAGSALARPALDGGGGGTPVAAAASQDRASEVSTGLGTEQTTASPARASEVSTGLGTEQTAASSAPAGRAAEASEVSTGIIGTAPASPSEVSSGIVHEPGVTPAEVSTGITSKPTGSLATSDSPSWAPSATEGALAAGMILAVGAVGFIARSRRQPPATA
jgi:hypothetical protein